MDEINCYLWLTTGLSIGIAMPVIAKAILGRFLGRVDDPLKDPKRILVVLDRESLDSVAKAVSQTVLDATQQHIRDLGKPSAN